MKTMKNAMAEIERAELESVEGGSFAFNTATANMKAWTTSFAQQHNIHNIVQVPVIITPIPSPGPQF